MRLLNTKNVRVEDFTSSNVPAYAILSHRWGDDEVSYQDLRYLTETDETRQAILQVIYNIDESRVRGKAFDKIKRICNFATRRGLEWIWVDTCCINRESSAELSEAINSMFKWYQRAEECYVFLSDFHLEQGMAEHFGQSKWFSRGWTLQELLAPRKLLFLDLDFHVVGSKQELAHEISECCGISVAIITGQKPILDESVATCMSWAARRNTTRPEDMAYCLLGLFKINLPLMYGEGGPAAFKRLQEEIIRSSDDETIFAHSHTSHSAPSALAQHPRNFLRHKKLVRGLPARFLDAGIGMSSYAITNKGVEMRPPFIPFSIDSSERAILLNCHFEGDEYPVIVPIASLDAGTPLVQDATRARPGVWRIRIHSDFREHIGRAKVLIDHALRYSAPKRKLVEEPFECETIYLR